MPPLETPGARESKAREEPHDEDNEEEQDPFLYEDPAQRFERYKQADAAPTITPEILRRIAELEAMITCIPRVSFLIRKTPANSFADSPFVESIGFTEMPRKFSLPNMRLYDGTTDPDDHIAQYKQRMFTMSIPLHLREACLCKGFGYSLTGPALQWYTNLPNYFIASFAQLNDVFVE